MKKTHKKAIKYTLLAVLSVTLITAAIFGYVAYQFFNASPPEFAVPIPDNWELVEENGEITATCLGSWEECGSIERIYAIEDRETAIEELPHAVQQSDWVLREDSETESIATFTARDKEEGWDRIGYITIEGSTATVEYVKR